MKRFLWVLSGIISAILITIASSGLSAFAEVALPTDSGIKPVSYANFFLGSTNDNSNQQQTCTYKVGDYLACAPQYSSSAGNFVMSGFDIHFETYIPANSYSTFSIDFFTTNYPKSLEFNGFVANSSVEDYGVIVNQQVLQYDGRHMVLQITMFNEVATNRLSLKSSNGKGIVFIGNTDTNKVNINISSVNWISVLSGSSLINSLKSANDLLYKIANNGIKATVDNSNVISQLQQGQQQAHTDAQNQLNESKKQTAEAEKQTQIQEEQKNFVTDTSTPDASDIANDSTIPSSGLLPDGPLDSILLLPVNILNSIIQSFGGSCKPIEGTLPFVDEKLVFPCFNESVYKGSFEAVANIAGGVASAFLLYGYFKHLYKKVDRAVSMETTDEDEWGIL